MIENMPTTNATNILGVATRSETNASDYLDWDAYIALSGRRVDIVLLDGGAMRDLRLSDLRLVAGVLRGRRVHSRVRLLVMPGSDHVRNGARTEGIDEIFCTAGVEWPGSGSTTRGVTGGELVDFGGLAVSTGGSHFENHPYRGTRIVFASPLTAAVCAVAGRIVDPRVYLVPGFLKLEAI